MSNITNWFEFSDNFKKHVEVNSVCIIDTRQNNSSIVTIAIPTYLRSNTLKETIDSALNQEVNFAYEVMVLDNNPDREDETEQLMKNYSKYPNISYYKNSKNLGMGGNWNRIFTLARTQWVAMVHDDDLIVPSFLQTMLKIAKNYNADVVNSGFQFYKEKSDKSNIEALPVKGTYNIIKSTLASNFFIHRAGMPSGILYKRIVYLNEGGVAENFYPSLDYVFHSKLSYKYRFLIYDAPLTVYRWGINESLNIHTIESYINQDYEFRIFLGSILNWPQRLVKIYANLISRNRINIINKIDSDYCENKLDKKALNILERLFLVTVQYLSNKYFDKINKIGSYKLQ